MSDDLPPVPDPHGHDCATSVPLFQILCQRVKVWLEEYPP